VTTTRFSLAPLKPKVANPSKNPSSNLPRIASKTRVSLWYNVTQRFSGTSRFTIPAKISNTYSFKTASACRASTTNLIRFAELYLLKIPGVHLERSAFEPRGLSLAHPNFRPRNGIRGSWDSISISRLARLCFHRLKRCITAARTTLA
jgi:hypothetical protein